MNNISIIPTTSKFNDSEEIFASMKRVSDTETGKEKSERIIDFSDESDNDEILLSVTYKGNKFGAAHYNINNSELHILQEIVDRYPEHLMLCSLFYQLTPVRVITEGRMQNTFIERLKSLVHSTNNRDTNTSDVCKLVVVPANEFNYEACRRRLEKLKLTSEPKNCSDEERKVFLKTLINFSQIQSIHALGALIKYLDSNWSNLSMSTRQPEYFCLRKYSLNDIVSIDEETYNGLQIFNNTSHPSNFKMGMHGCYKEGLSVYRIYNNSKSKVGGKMMRLLMRQPTRNIETLNRRLDAISFCMKPQNEDHIIRLCSSLRYIKNVNGILTKIKSLTAVPYQWKTLYNTLYNAVIICEISKSCHGCTLFEELASCNHENLSELVKCMTHIIDFEQSKSQDKFTVKAGIDPELDKKKQVMASLHSLMSETAKRELEKLPAFVEECTMVYIPHLGYLLGVKSWAKYLTMEQKDIPDMKFMFQNHDYIHYKSKGCEELDIMIGDTYPEIIAHETRIMMRLTEVVVDTLENLNFIIDKCAELDCVIAMSKVCKELNFVRPKLVMDKIIKITNGRHILHEIIQESFVPNDTISSQENGFVKILTGPNSSGKSVYLKQVATIIYLAHIGSYVPADEAEIGIIDHIFTRINSVECVALQTSSFLNDLRQMSLALSESTKNTLIIIDEFGKGTSEIDGLSLLAACLNTFINRDNECPHIFLSTHFLNLSDYVVSTRMIKLQSFEHIIQDNELVFLYKLIEGTTEQSFAIEVAQITGIESKIIKRAKHIQMCIKDNKLPVPNSKTEERVKSYLNIEILKQRLKQNERHKS